MAFAVAFGLPYWTLLFGGSSGFTVLPSAGTPSYTVTLTVLDSAGTGFTVPQAVLDSAGTSYNPV